MTFGTVLKLGRVSNLPTVWTNAIAGAVLSGHTSAYVIVIAGLALSLFYIGGMWLNDAFDAQIDAAERANRPIPMGEIGVGTVFAVGFALLGLGIVLAFALGSGAGMVSIALALAILLYDWLHKRTVLSPVIMGATRFFCYLLPAAALGSIAGQVLFGALGLLFYIVGLTYAAKQEAYDRLGNAWPLGVLALPLLYACWHAGTVLFAIVLCAGLALVVLVALRLLFRRQKGDVPKAVVTMIAGISLYDAALIAGSGHTVLAIVAVAGFACTLALQKAVSGT